MGKYVYHYPGVQKASKGHNLIPTGSHFENLEDVL